MPRFLISLSVLLVLLVPSAPASDHPHAIAWWGKEPLVTESSWRECILLNGPWRFLPATMDPTAPQSAWGLMRVPGNWRAYNEYQPGLIAAGQGAGWQLPWHQLHGAWYERPLTVPAHWQGREVVLHFERLGTEAWVWVDGKAVGAVPHPGGEVNLTAVVTPGRQQTVRVLVIASQTPAQSADLAKTAPSPSLLGSASTGQGHMGIVGDVTVACRPTGARLDWVHVRTSTRQHRIETVFQLAGVADAHRGPLAVTADITDLDGTLVRRFTATIAASSWTPGEPLSAAWDWQDPILWEVGAPHQYHLHLSVEGTGIADGIRERFGFREFWVEGKEFMLNGSVIRLRPDLERGFGSGMNPGGGSVPWIDATLDARRASGINATQFWPWESVDGRHTGVGRQLYAERASYKGFVIIAQNLDLSIPARRAGPGSPTFEAWRQAAFGYLRQYWNEPSVLMWIQNSGTLFEHGQALNAALLGRKDTVPVQRPTVRDDFRRKDEEEVAAIKAMDPTRPIVVSNGAPAGDVYGVNLYLSFTPLQEREDYLSAWAEHGDMPVMMTEFGTPYMAAFYRGKEGQTSAKTSEPLFTEFAASMFGPEIYQHETAAYRRAMRDHFQGGQDYRNFHNVDTLQYTPLHVRLQELFTRNTQRSWRTWGLNGGMIQWVSSYGFDPVPQAEDRLVDLPAWQPGQRGFHHPTVRASLLEFPPGGEERFNASGRAMVNNQQPTLAYIGGPAAAFTAKDHLFAPGATVTKSIVLINDERTTQPYSYTWSAKLAEVRISGGNAKGKLEPGEIRLLPLAFTLPADAATGEGVIDVNADIGTRTHRDTFAFTVPTLTKPVRPRQAVAILDPVGSTTSALRTLDIPTVPWSPTSNASVLLIGRNALGHPGLELPDLTERVSQGLQVVIFTQQPEQFQALGFRTSPHSERRAFPVVTTGMLDGITPNLLRDWAGDATQVDPYPDYTTRAFRPGWRDFPYAGWRWGNRGAISSVPLEKPHLGGWTPLIESGVDLAYSPLLELSWGHGRVLLCTLDLEDRVTQEPLAAEMLRRIVTTLAEEPQPRKVYSGPAQYLGGDAGKAFLDALGAEYVQDSALPADIDATVLIGEGVDLDDPALLALVGKGGRVVILPRQEAMQAVGFALHRVTGSLGSLTVPPLAEARGLSVSDLRLRNEADLWLLKTGDDVYADGLFGYRAVGRGTILWCQVDPRALPADERTYLRWSRWRWTRAVSQVLANHGVRLQQARSFLAFTPRPPTSLALAGDWDAMLTTPLPPSKVGNLHTDTGISVRARQAIAGTLPEGDWETRPVPSGWEAYGGMWKDADGEAVYRKRLTIPKEWIGQDLRLSLGTIDDFDATFVNGVRVGVTGVATRNSHTVPRTYLIPGALVNDVELVVAIRVFDNFGGGGMTAAATDLVLHGPEGEQPEGLYHPDYRSDFRLGDDPYRYSKY